MSSPHRQFLPEGLAQPPPGPRLGAVLAEIDPVRLTAADAQTYMTACHRQGRLRADPAHGGDGLVRAVPARTRHHDARRSTFDDTEAESDETGIWADPEHPSGNTSTGKTPHRHHQPRTGHRHWSRRFHRSDHP